jgi:titin
MNWPKKKSLLRLTVGFLLLFAFSCGGGKKSAQPTGPDETTPVEPVGPTNLEKINSVLGLIQSASDFESGKTAVREAFLLSGLGSQDDSGAELQEAPFFAGLTPFGVEVLAQALIAHETTTLEKFTFGLEGVFTDSQGNSLRVEDLISVLQYVVNQAYQDKESPGQNPFLLISSSGGSLTDIPPQIGLNTELSSVQSTILGLILTGHALRTGGVATAQSHSASLRSKGYLPQSDASPDWVALSAWSHGTSIMMATTAILITGAMAVSAPLSVSAITAGAVGIECAALAGAATSFFGRVFDILAESDFPNSYSSEFIKENPSERLQPPTNMKAVIMTYEYVGLTWQYEAKNNEKWVAIERKEGPKGSYAQLDKVADITAIVDYQVECESEYYYRAKALADVSARSSDYSNEASVVMPPCPPTDLKGEAISETEIKLEWEDHSDTETGFRVEEKKPGGDFRVVGTMPAGKETGVIKGCLPDTTYAYRVTAVSSSGQSKYSNEIQVTTPQLPILKVSPKSLYFTAKEGGTDPPAQSTQIENIGGGTLKWNINSYCVRVSPQSGEGPATVSISVVTSGKTSGLHREVITVEGSQAGHEPVEVLFEINQGPPLAPSGFSATPVSPTQINLTWNNIPFNEQGFRLERKAGAGGSFVWISQPGVNATSFSDNGLNPNTVYSYRILAFNASGASSWVETSCTTPVPNIAAPTGLQAQAVSGPQVDLSWQYTGTVDGFDVYRQNGGIFQKVGQASGSSRTYSVTGLYPGQSYTFYLKAVYLGYGSNPSNTASATTLSAPVPPSNLSATAITATRIDLLWQDKSGNEDGFRVYRKRYGGAYEKVKELGQGVQAYSDTGLTGNTLYYYQVAAFNSLGERKSSEVHASTQVNIGTPTNLQAIIQSSTSVRLTWEDNSDNEEYFWIYMNDVNDGTGYKTWKTDGPNIVSYNAAGLTPGKVYYFFVRAEQAVLFSNASNWATADLSLPSAPTNLQASAFSSTQVNLSFQDNANNEVGFVLQRMNQGDPAWRDVASLGPKSGTGSVTHSDTGLAPQTQYYYRVKAYNKLGSSSYSNHAWAVTLPPPALPAPSNLQATIVSASQVNLSWTDNSSGEDRFEIYMSEIQNQLGSMVGQEVANATSHSQDGLIAGRTYYIRVKACKGTQCSDSSSQTVAHLSIPSTPTSLGATAVSSSQINLGWVDNSDNESGFKIELKTGTGGTWGHLTSVGKDALSYSNSGLNPETTYFYRVYAYNGVGNSGYSNESQATTSQLFQDNFETGNLTKLPWVTGGNSNWTVQSSVKYEGNNASASGTIVNSQSTYLQVTLNLSSDGNIYFYRQVSSETNYDYLKFYIDGVLKGQWSGSVSWGEVFYPYSSGTHTFKWEYMKDSIVSVGSDKAWIDNVRWIPPQPPGPPLNLQATAQSYSISIFWTDNSNNEDGFKIERKIGGGSYVLVGTVGANSINYGDTNIESNTIYYYRIYAYNSYGNSAYSNEASISTGILPGEFSSDSNTLALWHFNEGLGLIINDESPNNNDGTIYGSAWGAGRFENSLYFDGANDYIQTPCAPILSISDSFSIELWIKVNPSDLGTLRYVVGLERTDHQEISVIITADGKLRFYIRDDNHNANYCETTVSIADNQWHYFTGVRKVSSDSLLCYVDEVLSGVATDLTVTWDNYTATRWLALGADNNSGFGIKNFFKGYLDEIRISNIARNIGGCVGDNYVDMGTYYIGKYEASRHDATSTSEGTDSSMACSRAGVIPWKYIDWYDAKAACEAAGARLCEADEWGDACDGLLGSGGSIYPYGNTYLALKCNGSDAGNGGLISTGSMNECISSFGVYDMSGNSWEWTNQAVDTRRVRRGGSYTRNDDLMCTSTSNADPNLNNAADYGFRCCRNK